MNGNSAPGRDRIADRLDAPPDVAGYVRRARRLADMSQRDLAAAVGLAQSRIARIENGQEVDVATFARILAAAGLRMAVVDDAAKEVPPTPRDELRDRAGRHEPAHLDVHAPPERPSFRMLLRAAEPASRGHWYHRRRERDRLRREAGLAAPPIQPTTSSIAAAKRAQHLARARHAKPWATGELARMYERCGRAGEFRGYDRAGPETTTVVRYSPAVPASDTS